MSMKKSILRIFSLIVYLLLACLILSRKIEQEMMTQVEVYTAKAIGIAGSRITLPARILFEGESATDLRLYEVVDGTGWEVGPRLREVPTYLWSLRIQSPTYWEIDVPRDEGRRYVVSASRHPQDGAQAQIIAKYEKADDQHLAIYLPPKAVAQELLLPSNAEVMGQSEHALLLNMTDTTFPFFQHKAKGMSITTDSASRIFSLTEGKQFFAQLPCVVMVFLVLAAGLVFWVHACCMSIRLEETKAFFWLDVVLIAGLLLLAQYFLSGIDLPASMLPEANILQLSYYREELSMIFTAMEDFPEAAQDLISARDQAVIGCKAVLRDGVLLTAAVLALERLALWRKSRAKRSES